MFEASRTRAQPDFRAAFDATPGICALLTPECAIVAVNDGFCAAIGRRRQDVLGARLSEVLGNVPGGVAALQASLARVANGQGAETLRVPGYGVWQARPQRISHLAVYSEAGEITALVHRVEEAGSSVETLQERSQLECEVVAQRRRSALLEDISKDLAETLDYENTLERIAHLPLPHLADFCVVDVVGSHRRITRAAVAHSIPAQAHLLEALKQFPPAWDSPHPSARVLRQGVPELLEDVTETIQVAHTTSKAHLAVIAQLGVRTHMAVPMRVRGRMLGVLSLGGVRPGRRFTAEDLSLAEALAERAAFALDSASFYREAQAALEARDDFLLIAAHELRTPLTSLLLQVHTLRRRAAKVLTEHPAGVLLGERLDLLRGQCERLGQLIDGMLDVARIAQGQFVMKLEPVDFSGVVEDVLSQVQRSGDLERAHCTLSVEVEPHVVGQWDKERLAQLLHHLLANALRYGAGEPVQVILRDREGGATLTVRDHGLGIDPTAQASIFERFARATSFRNYGGLGVGLYVVRQITEALGGSIHVQSAPNAGSTFTVQLPRATAPTPADWPARRPPYS